ncbi:MAG: metal-sulfur cluster assembly factor [Microgenomates group bacterium]
MITKKEILKKLEEVIDPELGISIVDLGLVYDVVIKKSNEIKITMTLTTIGCPLISVIESDIKNKLEELGVNQEKITIDLTFDPPWSVEKMSAKAKATLGF